MTGGHREAPYLFRWRDALAAHGPDEPAVHLVALRLSTYMDDDGSNAYPGATRLARETRLHVSTVRRHLRTLVAAGWLEQTETGGQRGEARRANAYQAAIPNPSHDATHHTVRPIAPDAPTPSTVRADPSHDATPPLHDLSTTSPPAGDLDAVDEDGWVWEALDSYAQRITKQRRDNPKLDPITNPDAYRKTTRSRLCADPAKVAEAKRLRADFPTLTAVECGRVMFGESSILNAHKAPEAA